MSRVGKLLSATLAFVVGHLLYQLMQAEPNWSVAWERIWFQANAIIMYEILWANYE